MVQYLSCDETIQSGPELVAPTQLFSLTIIIAYGDVGDYSCKNAVWLQQSVRHCEIDCMRWPVGNTLSTYKCLFITALHGMQTRSSDKNSVCRSVCPSVCLSNAWIVTKRNKNQCRFFIRHERLFNLVFLEEEWLVRATSSTWNFGSTGLRWSEIADFEPIIARSTSALTPSEKSPIKTNRKFTKRFPMSLWWSSYALRPYAPQRGLKTAKLPISVWNRDSIEESLLHSSFLWKLSATKL